MDELLKSKRSSLLSSLVSQNMTLKIALIVAGSLLAIETIALVSLGMKRPIVVGLTKTGPEILSTLEDEGSTGPQIRAFVFELLNKKFPPKPTLDKLALVCPLLSEGLKVACEKEVRDKKSVIPQDFLVQELVWNDKTETARVLLKRYANFNGSITSIDSTLNLRIIQRARTAENPWGLFVESWKEEVRP